MPNPRLLLVLSFWCAFLPVRLAAQSQPTTNPAAAASTTTTVASSKAVPASAANPQTPQEFFARARALSDLEASGIPFHLKATYVATGDAEFTGNGTYEEWWQSKDLWRKEATLGNYRYVEIKSGEKSSVYAASSYIPLRLRQTLDAVPIQIAPDSGTASKWKLKHRKLKGVDLAVLSSEYECGDGKYKAKCVAEDYFTQEGVLRIQLRGSVEDVYNDFEPLQSQLIPRNIGVAGGEGAILQISVTSLESLSTSEKILLNDSPAPANLQRIKLPIDFRKDGKPYAGVIKGKLISESRPIYPGVAKQQQVEGTVVIDATIDETGKIREPFVIHSSGRYLDAAALDAVRTWRYKPATINDVPIEVTTTISVVFALNHR